MTSLLLHRSVGPDPLHMVFSSCDLPLCLTRAHQLCKAIECELKEVRHTYLTAQSDGTMASALAEELSSTVGTYSFVVVKRNQGVSWNGIERGVEELFRKHLIYWNMQAETDDPLTSRD